MSATSLYQGKIKVFLDGAERALMLELSQDPKVAGFTTNPSLMKKSGVRDYKAFCLDLLAQVTKPISFEVFADDLPEMLKQAQIIAKWEQGHGNLYVKIPVINTRGESTAPLIRELAHQGVQLNVTAIYTPEQVQTVCDALKGGARSIVSVFAGRIADAGRDPIPVMEASSRICRAADPKIELLWASTREAFNVIQAEQVGCQIITAPHDVIKKMAGFGRSSQDLTYDTVKAFKADSEAAGFTL